MSSLPLAGLGRYSDFGLLLVRVIIGVILFAHGYQKLFDVSVATFGEQLSSIGVPLPALAAWIVALVEFAGGLALILGVLSRVVALLATVDLLMAILLVKLQVGLIAEMGGGVGAELDLALIAGLLVILLVGPGRYSVDAGLTGGDPGVGMRSG